MIINLLNLINIYLYFDFMKSNKIKVQFTIVKNL